MNKRKLGSFALCAMLFALCFSAQAQEPAGIPRIGFVTSAGNPNSPGFRVEAFKHGLRELGYVEGKNILVEYRYIEGKTERVPEIVAELVQLKPDVLVLLSLGAVWAAKQATRAIPIVTVVPDDLVALGIVNSLARPGGNITWLTRLTGELRGKRLELLKEVVPRMSRIGVLLVDANTTGLPFKDYETAASALKIPLQSLEVRGPNPDFEGAFQAAAKARVSALIAANTSLLNRYPKRIADLAIKYRLPSMYEASYFVEAGGLMSYASNEAANFKRAAYYVDKILKGAKPADLPVEQPTKFEFVVNLKTAKQIGLTIPQSVLYRADKVIK